MTTQEVYEKYTIPPWLQLHQLRVAAVGATVARHGSKADERIVILTGLFHDTGNILKFDLSPDGPLAPFLEEKGIEYWQGIKREYEIRYGSDEHAATIAIGREIGLPDRVVQCMAGISFSNMQHIRSHGSLELQISEYADMRVGPFGILPMQERLDDLRRRNNARWAQGIAKDMESAFDTSVVLLKEIEEELFRDLQIQPHDITDESVTPIIEQLWDYEIA